MVRAVCVMGETVSARSVARPGIRHSHGLVLDVFDHGGADQAETEQRPDSHVKDGRRSADRPRAGAAAPATAMTGSHLPRSGGGARGGSPWCCCGWTHGAHGKQHPSS
jgi:hypothetical protein